MAANPVSLMLREGLVVQTIGRRLLYHHALPSTMDEAARLAQEGAEEGTVVIAGHQTAGRGRFGRTWVSSDEDLLLSIIFRPSLYSLRYLSILIGVASARAIVMTTGLQPTIKWPNDLRIGGKKVGGLLVESSVQGNQVSYAVVGIGINVALDPDTLGDLAPTATSLAHELGRPVPRHQLLGHLLQETDDDYRALKEGKTPLDQWRSLLDTLGKQVRVQAGQPGGSGKVQIYSGLAEDVDQAGNLLLRLANGRRIALPAGEVTLQDG